MALPWTVVANRDDLELAFEFGSSGAPSENTATISVATGKVRWHSVSFDVEDGDEPDDAEDASGYISVPHKNDQDLGSRFVGQQMPRDYDKVADFFRQRGAYGRFKDLLRTRGMLEQWYESKEHAADEALLAWCEENGIRLVDEPAVSGG